MANDVFANGREVSCKKADGKSICAFPDVCFTPPENPATPPGVPIPYPNTGMAKDMTSGSKNVKISDNEVMLKNRSYFKKSIGNEAGSAAKKGVVTSVNRGKVYFISWSMDVKFEGENVVRHLDMTTHNHASPTTNTPPWVHIDSMAMSKISKCAGQKEKIEDACDPKEKAKCPDTEAYSKACKRCKKEFDRLWDANLNIATDSPKWAEKKKKDTKYQNARKAKEQAIADYSKKINTKCLRALRCNLVKKEEDGKKPCCPPQTPHHIVPASQFRNPNVKGYVYEDAPCICLEGQSQYQATHAKVHWRTANATKEMFPPKNAPFSGEERWEVGEAEKLGAEAVAKTFTGCDADCIEAQVRKMHLDMGIKKNEKIKPTAPGPAKKPKPTTRY